MESAPPLAAPAKGFAAIAPGDAAPDEPRRLTVALPVVPAPALTQLPLPMKAPLPAPALASENEARRLSYLEIQPVAATGRTAVDPLPFAAIGTAPRLPVELRLQIGMKPAPAEPDLVPLEYFFRRSRATTALPAEWSMRTAPDILPIFPLDKVGVAAPLSENLGLPIATESPLALPARAEGFASLEPSGAAPGRGRSLAVELAAVPVSTPVLLPLPIGMSAHAPALASETEALRVSYPEVRVASTKGRADIEPLPLAAVGAATRLPTELGLQIEMKPAPVLTVRAKGFAAEAAHLLASAGTARSANAVALKRVDDAPDFKNHSLAEADLVPLEYYCQRSRATIASPAEWSMRAAPCTLPVLPFDKVGAAALSEDLGLRIAIESALALPARAEGFAAVASSGAAPGEACSLPIESPVLPRPTPVLLPPPIGMSAPAPALAGETEALRISYPEVRAVSATAQADIEPLPFAAVGAAPQLPGELGLQIDMDAPVLAARGKSFAAVTALFPATPESPNTVALEPVNDEAHAPDFENHPPGEADLVPLEYYCQRSRATTAGPGGWSMRAAPCILPVLPFDKVVCKIEDLLPGKEPAKPFFAATPKVGNRRWGGRYLEPAAAAMVLATVLATGIRIATRAGTETSNVRNDVVTVRANGASAWMKPASGPLSQIRSAIAGRASVEISDTFRAGMEAWGHVKALAPGWNRSPDGYVQPGQLALFQPSMKFTDYRMEFLGQIESKSMDWVVRARDRNNYYAMKFTVIQKGLRPVIAVVHYPVVGGKPGRRSTIPLSVMVHNNQAYRVDVAVNGSRIVTSIEGQEVDRWIEDSVPSGGVGFFTETDERARVYWMKVAKNEDFLGRVCAYLTGGSSARQDVATLAPQGFNPTRGINQGVNHGIEFFTAPPHGN
jgi:hypothetical protein